MIENTPATDEITYCSRHPKTETGLRCAHCDTPICPKCMVVTPVGMKCPDCGRVKNSPLFKVRPERFLLAGIAAVLAGVLAAMIGSLGFFVIFISMPYGYFAGTMIMKAAGMKRGAKLEVLTGICMILGALAVKILPVLIGSRFLGEHGRSTVAMALPLLLDPFFWLATILSTSCAISKIRYL